MAQVESARTARSRELLAFFLLAFVIWPFIAIGVVGTYGLAVWIFQMIYGPPGPPGPMGA